jgi:hypothetical protein
VNESANANVRYPHEFVLGSENGNVHLSASESESENDRPSDYLDESPSPSAHVSVEVNGYASANEMMTASANERSASDYGHLRNSKNVHPVPPLEGCVCEFWHENGCGHASGNVPTLTVSLFHNRVCVYTYMMSVTTHCEHSKKIDA